MKSSNPSSQRMSTVAILASGVILLGSCNKVPDRAQPHVAADRQADKTELTAEDIDGQRHSFFAAGAQGTLFIFTLQDCPIANAYAPKIQKIHDEYSSRGIDMYLVHVDPMADAEVLRKHAVDFGFRCTILHDATHELVRFADASVTPQAVLFDQGGRRIYSGRIDDQYVALGTRRQVLGRDDLVLALDAFLDGTAIEQPETKPIGCYIADLAPSP